MTKKDLGTLITNGLKLIFWIILFFAVILALIVVLSIQFVSQSVPSTEDICLSHNGTIVNVPPYQYCCIGGTAFRSADYNIIENNIKCGEK